MRDLFACLGWILIVGRVVALEDSLFDETNDLLAYNINNDNLLAFNGNDDLLDSSSNDDLLDFSNNNYPSLYDDSNANDIFSIADDQPVDDFLMTLETTDNAASMNNVDFLLAATEGNSCVSSSSSDTDVELGTGIEARGESCRAVVKSNPTYTDEDARVLHPSEVNNYWCGKNIKQDQGSIPVCSLTPSDQIFDFFLEILPSTLSMLFFVSNHYFDILLTSASLVTPANFLLCPDALIFCCGYWVPDFSNTAGRSALVSHIFTRLTLRYLLNPRQLDPLGIGHWCWGSWKADSNL